MGERETVEQDDADHRNEGHHAQRGGSEDEFALPDAASPEKRQQSCCAWVKDSQNLREPGIQEQHARLERPDQTCPADPARHEKLGAEDDRLDFGRRQRMSLLISQADGGAIATDHVNVNEVRSQCELAVYVSNMVDKLG